MRIITIVALYLSAALALEIRQATQTSAPDIFSSAAQNLISLYIPSSIQTVLYSYYTSLESVTTGDPAQVIESAFTAVTPPAWLEALPTEYQSNVQALKSAVESLRVAASEGVGAIVTAPATSALTSSASGSASASGSESTAGSSESVSTSEGSSRNGSASSSGTQQGSGGLVPQRPTPSFIWGSSSSSGFVAPTNAPVAAAAGLMGFMGVVLAL